MDGSNPHYNSKVIGNTIDNSGNIIASRGLDYSGLHLSHHQQLQQAQSQHQQQFQQAQAQGQTETQAQVNGMYAMTLQQPSYETSVPGFTPATVTNLASQQTAVPGITQQQQMINHYYAMGMLNPTQFSSPSSVAQPMSAVASTAATNSSGTANMIIGTNSATVSRTPAQDAFYEQRTAAQQAAAAYAAAAMAEKRLAMSTKKKMGTFGATSSQVQSEGTVITGNPHTGAQEYHIGEGRGANDEAFPLSDTDRSTFGTKVPSNTVNVGMLHVQDQTQTPQVTATFAANSPFAAIPSIPSASAAMLHHQATNGAVTGTVSRPLNFNNHSATATLPFLPAAVGNVTTGSAIGTFNPSLFSLSAGAPENVSIANYLGLQGIGETPGLGVSSLKANKRKKPKGRPKRPLSAYNCFFKEERAKILQSLPDGNGSTSESKEKDPSDEEEVDTNLDKNDTSKNSPNNSSSPLSSPSEEGKGDNQPSRKSKPETTTAPNKKKKIPHGKIGFESLAKTIGQRWSKLDESRINHYKMLADRDMKRYKEQMEVYLTKQQHEEVKEKQAAKEEIEKRKREDENLWVDVGNPKKIKHNGDMKSNMAVVLDNNNSNNNNAVAFYSPAVSFGLPNAGGGLEDEAEKSILSNLVEGGGTVAPSGIVGGVALNQSSVATTPTNVQGIVPSLPGSQTEEGPSTGAGGMYTNFPMFGFGGAAM